MTEVTLNLETMSDEQLQALSLVFPREVSAERNRRYSFTSLQEAGQALAESGMALEALMEESRQTKAMKAVKESNVIMNIQKTVALLEANHNVTIDFSSVVQDNTGSHEQKSEE